MLRLLSRSAAYPRVPVEGACRPGTLPTLHWTASQGQFCAPCRFMGACTKPPKLSIVTQYVPRGSLFHLLHRSALREERRSRPQTFSASLKRGILTWLRV